MEKEKKSKHSGKVWLLIIATAALLVLVTMLPQKQDLKTVNTFDECVTATGSVAESYPRQCFYNGLSYVEQIENLDNSADELEDEDTSEWKSYENVKFRYEFSFPPEFVLFENVDFEKEKISLPTENSSLVKVTNNESRLYCCEPLVLSVQVLDQTPQDFESYVVENFISTENEQRIYNRRYADFLGYNAYRVDAESGIDSPGSIILFSKANNTFLIRYPGFINEFEAIINSFKTN